LERDEVYTRRKVWGMTPNIAQGVKRYGRCEKTSFAMNNGIAESRLPSITQI